MVNTWMFFSIRGALIAVLLLLGLWKTSIKPKIGLGIIISLVILRGGFLFRWFSPIYELHLPQIFIILTLVSWLIHANKYPIRSNLDIWLMFLFFIIICYSRYQFGIGVFDNDVPNEFFREFIIFFLAIQLLRAPKDLRNMLWLIVFLYLFLALRAYYLYKTTYMPIALPDYKLVNRNNFANSLVLTFPIAYILSQKTKNKLLKILGIFTAGWCVVGVILTYSRGGFIALVAGTIALVLFERKKMKLIAVLIILSILIIPHLSEKYINRLQSIETYEEDAAAMSRVATNYAAINMVKENPILGVGAGNFNEVVLYFTPPEYMKWIDEGISIHNVILEAVSETGFVGLFVFLLLIFRGFKNTFISRRNMLNNKNDELYSLAIMLRIALFALFIGRQFGQGAYFGNFYTLLPLISVFGMMAKRKIS